MSLRALQARMNIEVLTRTLGVVHRYIPSKHVLTRVASGEGRPVTVVYGKPSLEFYGSLREKTR